MRMHVLPGSMWLAYDMTHTSQIQAMLPSDLVVAPTRLYEHEWLASPKLLFNLYDVRSRFMRGSRIDVQTLATHRTDGTKHLVILDCITDTMQWDPVGGLRRPNAREIATPSRALGASSLHFVPRGDDDDRAPLLKVEGRWAGRTRPDQTFTVAGNRVCYFRESNLKFPMGFDEAVIGADVRRLSSVRVVNTLWRQFRRANPTHAFVHPHSMDFDVQVKAPGGALW